VKIDQERVERVTRSLEVASVKANHPQSRKNFADALVLLRELLAYTLQLEHEIADLLE
jgi:hypothetical protein